MLTTVFFYHLVHLKNVFAINMEHVYNDHPNKTNDLPLLAHPVIFHFL